jgi:limonene-1,2-epoxide hydrolase
MSDNTSRTRAFIDAFNKSDIDAIMTFVADDAVYHNIPVDPVRGRDPIRKTIEGFMGMASRVEWKLSQIAESDSGAVLTERVDRFLIRDRWVELPVMGTFEFEDGKLVAWRDYFDMQQFQRQLPRG